MAEGKSISVGEKKVEDKKEEVLYTWRRSRKAFLIEYACGLALLGLLVFLYVNGVPIPRFIRYFATILILLSLVSAEWARQFTCYSVTPDKIVITHGFIKQTKKSVHFVPLGFVPEINLKQNRIQRFLKYGTIFIHGSGESSLEIKDVDNPERAMHIVEDLIDKNRNRRSPM